MKVHISDWNSVLKGVQEVTGTCDPMDADAVLLYNDVRGSYKELTEAVHKFSDKKVYVMQHGRGATRDYDAPNSFPLLADKFLAWGQADKNRMTKLGYGDRTVIVGCPLLKDLQPKREHSGKYVVFVPINTDHEEPENLMVFYQLLQMEYKHAVSGLTRLQPELSKSWKMDGKISLPFHKLSDVSVVAKLLPRHDKNLYHGSTFVSSPADPRHPSFLFEILSQADCIVTLDESTTEIMAMAADVPVVCCDIYKWGKFGGNDSYSKVDLIRTKAAYQCKLENLIETVEHALANPDELKAERAAVVEHELGLSAGDPITNILNAIKYEPAAV